MHTLTATYSPEDNKLRLYSDRRLDSETYARVKAAGFKWAPKQDLFVAPAWTPDRADLLIELCGEIGDEDTSLVDRAEDRADRFTGYSDKRQRDGDSAHKAVKEISDGIPFGQPILVGHHSEKRARKAAQKIENGMRKAVKMWETSGYWKARAAGALEHAKYKERPDVRARRIKGLESDLRKKQREKDSAQTCLDFWQKDDLTLERALHFANYFDHTSKCFTLAEYPRDESISQYEGSISIWSALDKGIIDHNQARDICVPSKQAIIKWCDRWIEHINNRLMYERAMLGEQGATDLLKPKAKPKQPPLCNYRAPDGIDAQNQYRPSETLHLTQIEMTKAEYGKIWTDYKGTKIVENSHRIRVAMVRPEGAPHSSLYAIFLTDSKEHKKPEAVTVEPSLPEGFDRALIRPTRPEPEPVNTEMEAMRKSLSEGIKVVSAPQLFETPPEIAAEMVERAGLELGHSVLEPSAGTGRLLKPMGAALDKVAVEINQDLLASLTRLGQSGLKIIHDDFLSCTVAELGLYDRIIMNPPFANGEDIKHIQHALTFLKPGGRLIALCANGPRQQDKLRPMAEDSGGEWITLPQNSFKASGTGVNVAMLVYYSPREGAKSNAA